LPLPRRAYRRRWLDCRWQTASFVSRPSLPLDLRARARHYCFKFNVTADAPFAPLPFPSPPLLCSALSCPSPMPQPGSHKLPSSHQLRLHICAPQAFKSALCSGEQVDARATERRINSPSCHCSGSRASQRFQPNRPVIQFGDFSPITNRRALEILPASSRLVGPDVRIHEGLGRRMHRSRTPIIPVA
jgi:hypothetical protein